MKCLLLLVILLITILISILIFKCLKLKPLLDNNNNIIYGYLDKGCYYIKSNNNNNRSPTIVWIPGGGLSAFTFAFTGVGPLTIHNGKMNKNPNTLPFSQLFLDVGGLGYSSIDTYPTDDKTLVSLYAKYIKKFNLQSIVLIGISYGGKLSILLREILEKDNILVKSICITPFFDPYYTMAYIPIPGYRIGLYKIQQNILDDYRLKFKSYIKTKNFSRMREYMDDDGKFTKYTKKLLNQSILNMWSIKNNAIKTLGDWNIANILRDTQSNIESLNLFPGNNKLSENNTAMINSDAWETLAWTNNSYMIGVNLPSDKLTIISGTDDVICSSDGINDKWNSNKHKDNIKLKQIEGGPHLLILTHIKQVRDIIMTTII